VDIEALGDKAIDGCLELLTAPCGHGDAKALFAEHSRNGKPNPARRSRDDRCALRHFATPLVG
jgi:hypothetical protein